MHTYLFPTFLVLLDEATHAHNIYLYSHTHTHTYTHTHTHTHTVKVPQILKIFHAHSVENLSYLSFILELFAVTFTCTYNFAKGFPFR